jgi:hypothetical protein
MKTITTANLLKMLVDRDARKRAWELDSWGQYSDSADERMLEDAIETLAKRIDGIAQGPAEKGEG